MRTLLDSLHLILSFAFAVLYIYVTYDLLVEEVTGISKELYYSCTGILVATLFVSLIKEFWKEKK